MSEHAAKDHPLAGIIMVAIIAGLVAYGLGIMNDGNMVAASLGGVLLFLVGLYTTLVLGKE